MGDYVVDREAVPSGAAAAGWWLYLLLGLAAVVMGVILLLDLTAAVETLALLVALGLMFAGVGELVGSGFYRSAFGIAAGMFLIAAGIAAVAWPDITLWALAVVAAMGLLFSGVLRIAATFVDDPAGRGWLLAGGIVSLVAGVMALVWPGATILVLAILLGVHLLLFGIGEIAFALGLRKLQ